MNRSTVALVATLCLGTGVASWGQQPADQPPPSFRLHTSPAPIMQVSPPWQSAVSSQAPLVPDWVAQVPDKQMFKHSLLSVQTPPLVSRH